MSKLQQWFGLAGRRALVTGSTRGIGQALAQALAEAGATVVVHARNVGQVNAEAERLRAAGLAVETAVFDVADREQVRVEVARIEREQGAIDILVNNAGIQRRAPLERFDPDDWRTLMATNLDGVFHVSQAVAKHMIERCQGKIIHICSVQSELGRATIAPYAAAKGAVRMLAKGMCADWARYNIQINGLAPGYFATELNQALVDDPEFSAWLCQRTPAGRWGKVEELCGAAVFLASPGADFVNGQTLFVDGGLTAVV